LCSRDRTNRQVPDRRGDGATATNSNAGMRGRGCDESCVAADPEHVAAAAALLDCFKTKTKSQPFELQVTDAHTYTHACMHACTHYISHVIQYMVLAVVMRRNTMYAVIAYAYYARGNISVLPAECGCQQVGAGMCWSAAGADIIWCRIP